MQPLCRSLDIHMVLGRAHIYNLQDGPFSSSASKSSPRPMPVPTAGSRQALATLRCYSKLVVAGRYMQAAVSLQRLDTRGISDIEDISHSSCGLTSRCRERKPTVCCSAYQRFNGSSEAVHSGGLPHLASMITLSEQLAIGATWEDTALDTVDSCSTLKEGCSQEVGICLMETFTFPIVVCA